MKKSEKKKIELDEITKLSKKIFHAYFSGDKESWFSRLCTESIYLGTNEPILFGAEAIKRHFEKNIPVIQPISSRKSIFLFF